MSSEPHKQSIEPGTGARRAEQETRPAQVPRIEGGTSAREAERGRETSIGRSVHGFTLSARVGKPFRFENGVPQAAGEARPEEQQVAPAEVKIKKTNQLNDEKIVHGAAVQSEQAPDDSASTSFRASPGSLWRALFRRRTHPVSQGNDET
jgi:hypothetical protein